LVVQKLLQVSGSDVIKARTLKAKAKAKANWSRPRPNTIKAKATVPRPRPSRLGMKLVLYYTVPNGHGWPR